jgi:hypothetical protein
LSPRSDKLKRSGWRVSVVELRAGEERAPVPLAVAIARVPDPSQLRELQKIEDKMRKMFPAEFAGAGGFMVTAIPSVDVPGAYEVRFHPAFKALYRKFRASEGKARARK